MFSQSQSLIGVAGQAVSFWAVSFAHELAHFESPLHDRRPKPGKAGALVEYGVVFFFFWTHQNGGFLWFPFKRGYPQQKTDPCTDGMCSH